MRARVRTGDNAMLRTIKRGKQSLEYNLIQTSRKSGIQIKALPGGETRVYAPMWMHLRDIDAAVRGELDVILKMHEAVARSIDDRKAAHPSTEGSTVTVEGKPRSLHLIQGGSVKLELDGERLNLTLPNPESIDSVRNALKEGLCQLALQRIRERIYAFAPKICTDFKRVTIRDQKTRWGSCSSKHNLNFNWKLIQAPPEALDYVVIHELCHLIEFNHSRRFWKLVEEQMPEYEAWKKWLKDHGNELGV